MHRFHCTGLDAAEVLLPADEAAHALRVLRLREGHAVQLTDGAGAEAEGTLHAIGRHEVAVRITDRRQHPPPATTIHLAVAGTKQSDRFEWFVEKAVEVGVERITPLVTARTERGHLRTERLLRVAASAMKQSRRAWLPRIDALTGLEALLAEAGAEQRFVAHAAPGTTTLMRAFDPGRSALVLIGPEGDWTPTELERLNTAGITTVGLGDARLRTETAALAACTWMSLARQGR